jgi:HD-GYP domain-containing protein (c-di-GMP phosphodiesterase class II)
MRLISCSKIVEGVELARDVVTGPPGSAPLLRAGVRLSARYAELLPKAGIGSVWIEDDLGEYIDVEEPLRPETRAKVHRATGEAIAAARLSLQAGAGLPPSILEALAGVAAQLVEELLTFPDAALAFDDLSVYDTYTHRHSVQVTVLGLLIARRAWLTDGWVDYRGEVRRDRIGGRLLKLGLGLLIHDVGKLATPPDVLNKPGPLTEQEMDVMRTHPEAGIHLLRNAGMSPLSMSVISDHHERLDGSGYPLGLVGTRVQEFPRIAAVADVYDAVTSDRVYKAAAPPHVGVRLIREGSGTQFCPDVVRHFRSIVFPYPVGHEIQLPDGRVGVVAAVDPREPEIPVVRVLGRRGVDEIAVDMAFRGGSPRAAGAGSAASPAARAR